MRNDVYNDVGITYNFEIEAPTAVDARLPEVVRLIIFCHLARTDGADFGEGVGFVCRTLFEQQEARLEKIA